MTAKDTVRALLDRLPDDCSLDDVQYHLYVVQAGDTLWSIARAIADRIGAYIHLSYSNDLKKQGLRVEVAFPRTEDHAKE